MIRLIVCGTVLALFTVVVAANDTGPAFDSTLDRVLTAVLILGLLEACRRTNW